MAARMLSCTHPHARELRWQRATVPRVYPWECMWVLSGGRGDRGWDAKSLMPLRQALGGMRPAPMSRARPFTNLTGSLANSCHAHEIPSGAARIFAFALRSAPLLSALL